MNHPISAHIRAFKLGVGDFLKGAIPYVGYHNNANLGDVELYRIVENSLSRPLATDIKTRGRYFGLSKLRASDYYLVGGGTLIFAENILKTCEWLNSQGLKPVFLGTGAGNLPEESMQVDRWKKVFAASKYCGVRGTVSQEILQELDVSCEILGDLGFMVNEELEQPVPTNGEIVVIPRSIRPSYYEYFQKDMKTRELLADFIRMCQSRGLKVKVLSVSEDDAKVVRGWLKQFENISFFEYQDDFSIFRKLIQPAGCLVSMRMHPGIFSSSWGVPTVLLDQRHKFFDSFSPLDHDVISILDPDATSPQALLELAEEMLREAAEDRTKRLHQIKALARHQGQVLDKINRY